MGLSALLDDSNIAVYTFRHVSKDRHLIKDLYTTKGPCGSSSVHPLQNGIVDIAKNRDVLFLGIQRGRAVALVIALIRVVYHWNKSVKGYEERDLLTCKA